MRKVYMALLRISAIAMSTPVFMGGKYAKALCEAWNKTPQLVEQLGKRERWVAVPERKIFIYREGRRSKTDTANHKERRR